jgi:hypothetical protein
LPIETVDCEPDLFAFIANNPDVMVNIWQLMGVTNVSLDRLDADHFRCSDGDGTTAKVEVVYRGRDMQVIYAEGFYDGSLFPKTVRGQCVMILKYANGRAANGRLEETVRLDTFLHVDNIGLEIIAKLFQGVVGRTIDHNFGETVAFMGSMSHTAETNPRGIARVAARLNHVDQTRREQFAAVASHVADKLAGVKSFDGDENAALAEVIQSSAVAPVAAGKR